MNRRTRTPKSEARLTRRAQIAGLPGRVVWVVWCATWTWATKGRRALAIGRTEREARRALETMGRATAQQRSTAP